MGTLYYRNPLGFTAYPLSLKCPAMFEKPLRNSAEYSHDFVANFACQRAAWERKRNGGTADYIPSRQETYYACECDGQAKLKSKIAQKPKTLLIIREKIKALSRETKNVFEK